MHQHTRGLCGRLCRYAHRDLSLITWLADVSLSSYSHPEYIIRITKCLCMRAVSLGCRCSFYYVQSRSTNSMVWWFLWIDKSGHGTFRWNVKKLDFRRSHAQFWRYSSLILVQKFIIQVYQDWVWKYDFSIEVYWKKSYEIFPCTSEAELMFLILAWIKYDVSWSYMLIQNPPPDNSAVCPSGHNRSHVSVLVIRWVFFSCVTPDVFKRDWSLPIAAHSLRKPTN